MKQPIRYTLVVLGLVAVTPLATACAPRKVMVQDQFVPGTNKVARSLLRYASSDADQEWVHYYIEVCDNGTKVAENCNVTLVLENVTGYIPGYIP